MPRADLLVCIVTCGAMCVFAQQAPPPDMQAQQQQPTGALLSPQQLDDLVAPIALYPDPLLAQIMAASTYPMEIAEAEQWRTDHPKWQGEKLLKDAKKQNWDPSVQGLVAFPDVLARLSQNIAWTTQLGNAFLAQQSDVMAAVQRMRAKAEQDGRLQSSPQETVGTEQQNGQQAITIEPTNPNVWYVPYYNPAYVWGPPVWGAYPALAYPGMDVGFGWYPGIDVGLYFGGWGGWGWGGWGWAPNWYGGNIFIDHSFFHRYGFRDWAGGGYLGRGEWMHDPEHRLGVPYGNAAVANRFRGSAFSGGARLGGAERFEGAERFQGSANRSAAPAQNFGRGAAPQAQRFGSPAFEQRGFTNNHSVFGGYHNGGMTRMQSDRGFSSMGGFHGGGGGGFHGGGGGFHGGGRR